MAYDNLAGARADIRDGNLRTPETSSQPRILILGTASSGFSYETFAVTNLRAMEQEFGSDSEVARGVHEAIAQGADNLAVMRIGGTLGKVTITEGSDVLVIRPLLRDNEALTRYSMALVGGRLVVYDVLKEEWVYDSAEFFVQNSGGVEIEITGDPLTSLGDSLNTLTGSGSAVITDPATYIVLASLATSSFPSAAGGSANAVDFVAGSDGQNPTQMQRYAFLSQAYAMLDWTDGDFIIPMNTYVNENNLADGYSYTSSGNLYFDPSGTNSALGYAWEYEYQGLVYTFFTAAKTAGTMATIRLVAQGGSGVKAIGQWSSGGDAAIRLTARKGGSAGNSIRLQINASGTAGPTVSVSYNSVGVPTILVTDDGSGTYDDAVAAINAHPEAARWVTATGGLAGSTDTLATLAAAALSASTTPTAGVGGSYLDPLDLTGEAPPTAVTNYFLGVSDPKAQDVQLREVNFAHQLGSFCHHASTTWKALMGTISFKPFTGNLTRFTLQSWIGSLPDYTDLGLETEVASSGDNGTGILGYKLVAGKAGYRTGALNNPSSGSSGKAWGGIILTKGASLPNGAERPYGISDVDEKLDGNGKPVDLGKFLVGSYDFPIHRNSYNGGTPYRGAINALVAGKYATMPENQEAIGRNGRVLAVASSPKIHAPQQNRLAGLGLLGLKTETNFGLILTSGRTMAHPDSDYTDISTMRALNRTLNGIFEIANRYVGFEYSPDRLQALKTAVDAYLRNETSNGFNNGAKAELGYTVTDRILGKLTVRLRFVPPFSIRTIVVEANLAADESEL